MFSHRERQYLTILLPLGIVLAIVLDLVVFASGGLWPVATVSPGNPTCGGAGAPCPPYDGTSLALARPAEATAGPNHWYNFSVQSAGGGILLRDVSFQVVSATGGNVGPNSSWSLQVISLSGALVGAYSFPEGVWTAGGSTPITSLDIVILDTGTTDLDAQGDSLNVIGTGSFQGSIGVSIP